MLQQLEKVRRPKRRFHSKKNASPVEASPASLAIGLLTTLFHCATVPTSAIAFAAFMPSLLFLLAGAVFLLWGALDDRVQQNTIARESVSNVQRKTPRGTIEDPLERGSVQTVRLNCNVRPPLTVRLSVQNDSWMLDKLELWRLYASANYDREVGHLQVPINNLCNVLEMVSVYPVDPSSLTKPPEEVGSIGTSLIFGPLALMPISYRIHAIVVSLIQTIVPLVVHATADIERDDSGIYGLGVALYAFVALLCHLELWIGAYYVWHEEDANTRLWNLFSGLNDSNSKQLEQTHAQEMASEATALAGSNTQFYTDLSNVLKDGLEVTFTDARSCRGWYKAREKISARTSRSELAELVMAALLVVVAVSAIYIIFRMFHDPSVDATVLGCAMELLYVIPLLLILLANIKIWAMKQSSLKMLAEKKVETILLSKENRGIDMSFALEGIAEIIRKYDTPPRVIGIPVTYIIGGITTAGTAAATIAATKGWLAFSG
eukprot:TRINITY_DN20610_c0_g1_i3.p1 TRINITY_DN20610_c0_g1~~TRINITY_DN20610_c0_g1_i3.p1  ORF type:complete len:491 (+),score=85.27 TRINITY_DN20610_c0_g1_i3:268-1740(+)